MQAPSIKGIIAPSFLPLDDHREINYDVIPEFVEHFYQTGITAVFVNGTTGEFFNMTLKERKKVAEAWVKHSAGKLKIIVHIGASNLRDSQELARHAAQLKPAALAVVVTSFVPPQTTDTLVDYVKAVALTTPDTPVYYYHIPLFTHCKVSVVKFLERAAFEIPNLVGLKYTDNKVEELEGCVKAADGKFKVYPGSEDIYGQAMDLGCDTFVFGSASYAAALFHRMAKSHASGDKEALTKDTERMNSMHKIYANFSEHEITSCLKDIAALCDLNVGHARLPLRSASVETRFKLRENLEMIEFFQWRD